MPHLVRVLDMGGVVVARVIREAQPRLLLSRIFD